MRQFYIFKQSIALGKNENLINSQLYFEARGDILIYSVMQKGFL